MIASWLAGFAVYEWLTQTGRLVDGLLGDPPAQIGASLPSFAVSFALGGRGAAREAPARAFARASVAVIGNLSLDASTADRRGSEEPRTTRRARCGCSPARASSRESANKTGRCSSRRCAPSASRDLADRCRLLPLRVPLRGRHARDVGRDEIG